MMQLLVKSRLTGYNMSRLRDTTGLRSLEAPRKRIRIYTIKVGIVATVEIGIITE
jgi:hypothetical protein